MKTFIKTSENTIVNLNNVIKIIKADAEVNNKIVYIIKYYATDYMTTTQYFNSKEERDIFFKNVCNDLIY